jgi:hypothetical protein
MRVHTPASSAGVRRLLIPLLDQEGARGWSSWLWSRASPRSGRKIVAHGASRGKIGPPTPPEPRKGRKKSRPQATAQWHCSWAAAQGWHRKIAARIGSFAPPGLGGLYSNSHPQLALWATTFRPLRGL